MIMDIKDKKILITGGANGIGLVCVKKMLQSKAKMVAILDLPTANGPATVADLEKQFGKGKAVFIPCDVSNSQQFEAMFKKAVNTLNGVDVVINNAGIFDDRNWELTIKVNIGGVTQGTLLALEHMGIHKGGKGGVLVNVASLAGLGFHEFLPVYCASKHYVRAFSQCIAKHFENTGVRVGAICPGMTQTNISSYKGKRMLDFVTQEQEEEGKKLPRQQPENVAEAVAQIIESAPNGAIWVSDAENPPYAVEIPEPVKREIDQ